MSIPALPLVTAESEAVLEGDLPIDGDFVVLLEGVDDMVFVGFWRSI